MELGISAHTVKSRARHLPQARRLDARGGAQRSACAACSAPPSPDSPPRRLGSSSCGDGTSSGHPHGVPDDDDPKRLGDQFPRAPIRRLPPSCGRWRAEVNVLTAPAMAQVATVSGLDERSTPSSSWPPRSPWMHRHRSIRGKSMSRSKRGSPKAIGLLATVSPLVGSSRTVAAAGRLAFALGIDTGPNAGETD